MKFLLKLLFIVGTIAFIYHYKDNWVELISPSKPCGKPITYSIGTFDTRFGISKEDFIKDIDQAGSVWEKAEGKTLFKNSDTGTLKINLVYDYRQKATDQLKIVGDSISSDRDTYDALRITYNLEKSDYEVKKASLEAEIARGDLTSARQDQVDLNNLVQKINTSVTDLNAAAQKLNIKVDTFNSIGSSTGEEFDEGVYISDKDGTRINVYQFDTNDKLVRLLEHELGHALGLEHVADPNAIMYRLNSSTNQNPTDADIAELQSVCKQ